MFFPFQDFNFLTLGTYGTLREIDFTQELSGTRPELNEYYMGFYIHTGLFQQRKRAHMERRQVPW